VSTRPPDPYGILRDWLAGTYRRPDGQEVLGPTWDEDTRYRYGLLLAAWGAPAAWNRDWFRYIGDLVWQVEPRHVQDWASRLTNFDGTPMAPASRARAVSALRSFYRHCEEDLGAARWKLPPRRALAGPALTTAREQLTAGQVDALRTAADRYDGPHRERARLAVYLTLAGLRPGQSIALLLDHIRCDDAAGATWRLPAKNNSASAVMTTRRIPRPVVWAIEDYLPARTHKAPHSMEETGPLLVSRTGRALDRVTFPQLLRAVAGTHPDLTKIAPTLLPDAVAHSPSPFPHDSGL
jgi:site-specific recombinase XerD